MHESYMRDNNFFQSVSLAKPWKWPWVSGDSKPLQPYRDRNPPTPTDMWSHISKGCSPHLCPSDLLRAKQEERQVQEHANVPFEWDPVLPLWQVQCPAGGELVRLHPARGRSSGEQPGDEGPGRHQGVWTGLSLPGHGVLRPGQQAGGDLTL